MAIKRSSGNLLIGTLVVAQLALTLAISSAPGQAHEATKAASDRPHIDLAFCIDTTGSMSSEINNVKAKTKEIVAKLAVGKPAPVVRVGLVAYRDRGDEYVTKVFPFSEDIDHVVKDISELTANGGGDTPESVNEALHVSVHDLKWSSDKKTLKLLFVIGDAGPHVYPNDYDWHTEARQAIASGIQINTVGCQGLETSMAPAQGVDVFKQIAQLADGKYEPLSYRHEVAQADGTRATIVSSGGAAYKLAPGAADAWRSGASVLAAVGKAKRMDVSEAGASVGGLAGDMPMASASMAMDRTTRRSKAASFAAGAPMSAALSSREENNLADLVLSATKEAAKKRLNLDFKEK